jgi:hypothetical protein
MEKFSLYDLLSVLFPGVILLYMLNMTRELFCLFPLYELTDKWEILIVMAVMVGGVIYVVSFLLTSKFKWFYKRIGVYQPVCNLYQKAGIHHITGATLNKRANEWYGEDIYFSQQEYEPMAEDKKMEICNRQDEFYDRMYYQLDYEGKLTTPKSFQSFYLFFRNVFVATVISIGIFIILYLINVIPIFNFATVDNGKALMIFLLLLFFFIGSNFIARWYRKRTVAKMYWYFYTHINSKL